MVNSLGISIGNYNSYIAASQGGGVDILLNDYSGRATPAMVAFTSKTRCMGVDASSNKFSNLKNTIYDLMFLLGIPYAKVPRDEYQFVMVEGNDGQPLVVVDYLEDQKKFSIKQLLAMLFTKLRGYANDATDCVISCPQFYNDYQKSALFEAALIAGLNPIQIISDMSAVVLNYVYYRTNNKDNTDKFIAFINFGQSSLQTCVAWLKPGQDIVKILAVESELIGGRDFDKALADYFVDEYKLNLTPKGYLRLLSACENLKKQLSSTSNEIPLHVESLVSEEQDFTARIDRAKFEELSQNLLQQVEATLQKTLRSYQDAITEITKPKPTKTEQAPTEAVPMEEESKEEAAKQATPEKQSETAKKAEPGKQATPEKQAETGKQGTPKKQAETSTEVPMDTTEPDDIPKDFSLGVELVGGSTRIPAVKQLIQQVFQVAPSTTLNTDEAVVRGCVLHCATLHPGIKVAREVKIIGTEFFDPKSVSFDRDERRIELELVFDDKKYKDRIEARNNLEEYVYTNRPKYSAGDHMYERMNEVLEWLNEEEGDNATEKEYTELIENLKKTSNEDNVKDTNQVEEENGENISP